MNTLIKNRCTALERDNYTCQRCGALLTRGVGNHVVHHLDYTSDEVENLISLCPRCHSHEHRNSEIVRPSDVIVIQLKPETRERLKDAGTYRETYDDLINRLLDFWDGQHQR